VLALKLTVEPTPCKPQAKHSARYTTPLDVHVSDLQILKTFLVLTERKVCPSNKKFLQQSQRFAVQLKQPNW
jgi:hypothetical protein